MKSLSYKTNLELVENQINELETSLQLFEQSKGKLFKSSSLFNRCKYIFNLISNDYFFNISNEERKIIDRYISTKPLINKYFSIKEK